MCNCDNKDQLDRIEAKLDTILNTVGGAVDALSSNPMIKSFLGKF
jgi:hypothetical protein